MAGSLVVDTLNGVDIASSPVVTENKVLGVGQTWQDVTASRATGVTYTNTTGKPIFISVTTTGNSTTGDCVLYVNNIEMSRQVGYSQYKLTLTAIVPNGVTYRVTGTTLTHWFELR